MVEANAHPARRSRIPVVAVAILAALIAVYAVEVRYGVGRSPASPDGRSLRFLGAVEPLRVASWGAWTIGMLAGPTLHAGPGHLLGNAVAILIAGWMLEPQVGRAWTLGAFAASCLGGALASSLTLADNGVSVGASGGVSGLFAFTLVVGLSMPPGVRGHYILMAARILVPALLPPAHHADPVVGAVAPPVDVAAHLGGAAAGLATALVHRVAGNAGRVRSVVAATGWSWAVAATTAVLIHPAAMEIERRRMAGEVVGIDAYDPRTRFAMASAAYADGDAESAFSVLIRLRGDGTLALAPGLAAPGDVLIAKAMAASGHRREALQMAATVCEDAPPEVADLAGDLCP